MGNCSCASIYYTLFGKKFKTNRFPGEGHSLSNHVTSNNNVPNNSSRHISNVDENYSDYESRSRVQIHSEEITCPTNNKKGVDPREALKIAIAKRQNADKKLRINKQTKSTQSNNLNIYLSDLMS